MRTASRSAVECDCCLQAAVAVDTAATIQEATTTLQWVSYVLQWRHTPCSALTHAETPAQKNAEGESTHMHDQGVPRTPSQSNNMRPSTDRAHTHTSMCAQMGSLYQQFGKDAHGP